MYTKKDPAHIGTGSFHFSYGINHSVSHFAVHALCAIAACAAANLAIGTRNGEQDT